MTRLCWWLLPCLVGVATPALAAEPPDNASAAVLTQLAAVAAASIEGTEVLSSKDIQDIIALEGEKALMGCDEAGACLAEVAGALGARLVVFGQLGQLDDVLVLTLNLFDAESGSSSCSLRAIVDRVRVYGRALSNAEVEALFNETAP